VCACARVGFTKSVSTLEAGMAGDDRYLRFPEEANRPFFEWAGEQDAELDCSRITRSSEFRRLATVTQVVTPEDSPQYHSRLTHTIEVAQIGRMISRKLIRDAERDGSLDELKTQLDENVVESAGLAHDIGHPPFGHIAEVELDKLMRFHFDSNARRDTDGFEGRFFGM
jgi:dGTPase